MKSLYIKGTAKTPTISFDTETGVFEIKGSSIPENSQELYLPILDWLSSYLKFQEIPVTINITLDYFNTTSSKYLYELLKKFEVIKKRVTVNWFYEIDDEDTLMAGEEYQSLLKLEFNIIEEDFDVRSVYFEEL